LRLVRRPDAARRRSDVRAAKRFLARPVEERVRGQDDVRAVGDEDVVADRDAGGAQRLHLREKRARVDDEAVSDHVHDARAADARRDETQREVLVAELHGVAGVVAALIAGDEIEGGSDEVDDFALAFVAPLAPDDGEGRTFYVCHFWIVTSEEKIS